MLVSPSGVSPSDVALSMAQPFPVAAPPRRSLCVPPRRPPTLVARMALKAGGDVACCTHHAARTLTAGPRAASRCHAPLFHLHAHVERCIKPDHPARLRQGHHDRRLGGSSVVPGGAGRGAGSVKVRR